MRFTKTLASATVAAVLGLAGVSVAGATSDDGSAQPSTSADATASGASGATGTAEAKAGAAAKPGAKKARARRALRRHRLRRAGVLAAKTIGITPADLVKELRAGKTIAEIATEHGVTPQAVISALQSAATAKIEAAEAANKITAERAARLETRAAKVIPKLVNDWHIRKAAAG